MFLLLGPRVHFAAQRPRAAGSPAAIEERCGAKGNLYMFRFELSFRTTDGISARPQEEGLKKEIALLRQRLQEADDRNEGLVSATSSATR